MTLTAANSHMTPPSPVPVSTSGRTNVLIADPTLLMATTVPVALARTAVGKSSLG